MANIAIVNYCQNKCEYCILGGTEISMADGTTKVIEDVKVGDKVFGFDENPIVTEYNNIVVYPTAVTTIMSRVIDETVYHIKTHFGNTLIITGNHPIYTKDGWKNACEITENDTVYTIAHFVDINDNEVERLTAENVKRITPVEMKTTVYNFETESHTYIANGIAVHNCFAEDMIQEELTTITIDDYKKILQFISRTPKNHVGIIGGEPTLHPQFEEILKETNKYCKECNTSATLFTNGIELEKYIPYIGDRIGLLINCNHEEVQPKEGYKKFLQTLDRLYELSWFDKKANCGCNIHMNRTDYSYMWKIVDKYHLDHIRCSVVSPAAQYIKWRDDKEGYYNAMKPIFMQFVKDAKKHHCKLNMDCGKIPYCYFTAEEKEIIDEVCMNAKDYFCEPVVDITGNFQATACFGSYETVDIRDFDTLLELERYLFIEKNIPKVKANTCSGKCASCKKSKLLKCGGGCLSFGNAVLKKGGS